LDININLILYPQRQYFCLSKDFCDAFCVVGGAFGYAHIFVLLSVVIVTLPYVCFCHAVSLFIHSFQCLQAVMLRMPDGAFCSKSMKFYLHPVSGKSGVFLAQKVNMGLNSELFNSLRRNLIIIWHI